MDAKTIEFLDVFRNWAASLPGNIVKIVEVSVHDDAYDDDEYGSDVSLILTPTNPRACGIEIIVVPNGQLAFGVCLDRFSRVAVQLNIPYDSNKIDFYSAFFEPQDLPAEKILEICTAVAKGKIDLNVGLLIGKLSCSRAQLELPCGSFSMHGIGGPLLFYKLFRRVGLTEVRAVHYEPWC